MGGKLTIVSVDLGESPEIVKAFVHKMKATFPVALGTAKTAELFGVDSTPTNMVIAPDGRFVYLGEGYSEKQILNAVRTASGSSSAKKRIRNRAAAADATAVVAPAAYLTASVSRRSVRSLKALEPAPATAQASQPFPDVPRDHWAAHAVELLRERGIVIGYPPAPNPPTRG
ncbi:MAG TPA: hypothetical protein VFJ58_26295 [Armatimonadota bacterium]|nr:hypothetical protein [Armatimonadota bacterium]